MTNDIDRNLVETAMHRDLAERMVLSTALIDTPTLLAHLTALEPRDICNGVLRQLFELVGAMQRNKQPVTTQSILLAASRAGLINALGGPHGFNQLIETAPNVAHATFYRNEVRRLAKASRAFQAAMDSATRLSHKGCDADGELQFLRSLHTEESSTSDTLIDCDRALQRLASVNSSSRCQIKFGIPSLDAFVTGGLDCKWLVLVGARFGKGKSALGCQLFSNAVHDGKSAVMFSIEMTCDEVMQRVCTNEVGIPATAWRKKQRPADVNPSIDALRRQMNGRRWWVDDRASQTVESIRSKCELLKLRDGLDLVVIDNLQLIRSKLDSRQPRDIHYSTISKELKIMAKDLDCVVVLLCQLDTEAAKQRPTSANWASAKSIEGDADVALMIHESEDRFEIIGTKIRNGKAGFIPINFDGLYQRFESVNEYARDFL